MLKPLTIEEIRTLPQQSAVYLESRNPYIGADYPVLLSYDNYMAYIFDMRTRDTYCKFFKDYGLTGNDTGWRLWSEKPTIEDMFNAY